MPDRKTNRIRIDAIVNAIKKGEYDDKLPVIRQAINDRLEHKRQEVLSLVQEVYGEGYTVASTARPTMGGSGQGIVLQHSPRGTIPSDDVPTPDGLGGDEENGATDSDYESRSPIIGPHNP